MTNQTRENVVIQPVIINGELRDASVSVTLLNDDLTVIYTVDGEQYPLKPFVPGVVNSEEKLDRFIKGVQMFSAISKEKGHYLSLDGEDDHA